MLKPGITGHEETVVNESNTAAAMGSGSLPVFATPAMIALMEKTACRSIAEFLDENTGSVGTMLSIRHTSATPLGMRVSCDSILTEIDGRRLVFSVKAYDEAGLIGEGTHERFIVTNNTFLQKAEAKKT